MIRLYCRHWHSSDHGLCPDCLKLQDYCFSRLDRCVFGEEKPVCKDCLVHCYAKTQKEKIREVMKWAGPRMIFNHPVYAIVHLLDSKKKKN